jgi:rhodanese-related sulfurtransferase
VLIIDVREPEEFVGPLGHIPGAFNIPLANFLPRVSEMAANTATTKVLVCKTDKRSAKAAQALRDAGGQGVFVLRGGMEGWHHAGRGVAPSQLVEQ